MLQTSFDPPLELGQKSRLIISVDGETIKSYPMLPDDHYRDLLALKEFLKAGTLSTLFLGDEPMADVDITFDASTVRLTPYAGRSKKRGTGIFDRKQGLEKFRATISQLEGYLLSSKTSLARQVVCDIEAGVFSIYLKGG